MPGLSLPNSILWSMSTRLPYTLHSWLLRSTLQHGTLLLVMARVTFFFLVHCALILIDVLNITEYRNKTITRIFGGNARYGCYFLAVMIFICGILRDQLYVYFTINFPALLIMEHSYHLALFDQPQKALLPEKYRIIVSAALFITGQIFVVTSTWALGITGTFLGDYFGILMDHRVEG